MKLIGDMFIAVDLNLLRAGMKEPFEGFPAPDQRAQSMILRVQPYKQDLQ